MSRSAKSPGVECWRLPGTLRAVNRRRGALLALLIIAGCSAPATARGCPLARAVFEPVDDAQHFRMEVERDGDSFKFRLRSKTRNSTTHFTGTFQNGTGHLNLIEERKEAMSRAVLFRRDLRIVDPWDQGVRVAYAYFERLAVELWDRARSSAEDDLPGTSLPDGLWRVSECRPSPRTSN